MVVCLLPRMHSPVHMPAIPLARFVDNIYMGVTGVAQHSKPLSATVLFIETLLDIVYDVPLKWEKSGAQVDWCEARLVTQPEVALLMKGVTFQHPSTVHPAPDFLLWDRWVDCFSPNASTVCKSMVPVLPYKVVVVARNDLNRQINLASLVRGFSYKQYPRGWWWPPMRSAPCT